MRDLNLAEASARSGLEALGKMEQIVFGGDRVMAEQLGTAEPLFPLTGGGLHQVDIKTIFNLKK